MFDMHHTARLPFKKHPDSKICKNVNTHQASDGSRKPVYSLNDARFQLVDQAISENKKKKIGKQLPDIPALWCTFENLRDI